MKARAAFFRHIGAYRVKTAGRFHIPEVMAALSRLGVEHGLIEPEIAEARGVLPEEVELPPAEPELLAPPTVEDLAKEEVLSLLRNTPPPTLPEMPVEDVQPAPPAPDEI